MTNTPHKVRENRLRRAARRQGLRLERSRRRDPRAIGHGTCRLVDTAGNTIVAGGFTGDGYGMDLDDVARALGDAVAAAWNGCTTTRAPSVGTLHLGRVGGDRPGLLEGDHASPHPSQYYLHQRAMVGTVRAVFGRFAKPKHPSS